MLLILPAQQSQTQLKKKDIWSLLIISSSPVVFLSVSLYFHNQKKLWVSHTCFFNVQVQIFNIDFIFLLLLGSFTNPFSTNESSLLMKTRAGQKQVVFSCSPSLRSKFQYNYLTEDFRRVYESLENGLIFPKDKKLRCQALYLVGYLMKTRYTKRKKSRLEEVINVKVR